MGDTRVAPDERATPAADESASPSDRWRSVVPLLAAVVVLAAAFVALSPANRSESDDAYWYAFDLEHAPFGDLFNPRHIVYLVFGRGLRGALDAVGLHLSGLQVLSLVSAVTAAGAAVLMQRLLWKRFGCSFGASVIAAAGMVSCYGFLRYAGEAEVYAPVWFLTVLMLWMLPSGDDPAPTRRVVLGAVIAAVTAAFWLPGIALAGIAALHHLLQRRTSAFLLHSAIVVALTGAVIVVGHQQAGVPGQSIATYVTSYEDKSGSFGAGSEAPAFPTPGRLAAAARASAQTVVGANFLFAYDGFADRIQQAAPARSLDTQRFAGEEAPAVVRVLPPLALLALAALVVFLFATRWRRLSFPRRDPAVVGALAGALGLGLIALLLSPSAWEPYLPILPLLWFLLGVTVVRGQDRVGRRVAAGIVGCLAVLSLAGGLLVVWDRASDLNARRSEWVLDEAGARDVVLTAGSPGFFRYLRYEADAEVLHLAFGSATELEGALAHALDADGTVFVLGDVLDPPAYLEEAEPESFDDLHAFGTSLRPQLEPVHEDRFGTVYRLRE